MNFNIRSFHANGDEFGAVLNCFKIKPQVLILTETWNTSDTISLCRFDGLEGVHTFRTDRRGGGVSVFSNENFRLVKLDEISVCTDSIESCVCDIYTDSMAFLTILGLYRPPSSSISDFLSELEIILRSALLKRNQKVIIAGEFNINILETDNLQVGTFLSFMQSFYFTPTTLKPTRFDSSESVINASCLDQIWLNTIEPFLSGIIQYDLTDHRPNFILISHQFTNNHNPMIKMRFRPFHSGIFDSFVSEIQTTNWDFDVYSNVDENFSKFESKLNETYCKYFPIKTKILSKKRLSKPWLTPRLIELIKEKSNYYRLYRNGIISREINNRFKNKVSTLVSKSKRDYYMNIFSDFSKNSKKCWKLLKSLMGQSGSKNDIDKLVINNTIFDTNKQIADELNSYYVRVAENLEGGLNREESPSPLNYLDDSITSSFFMHPMSLGECVKLITNLRQTRTQIDCIPVYLLKKIAYYIAPILCKIINQSFSTGKFPKSLKLSQITPIFKNGNTLDPSNYRPISCLPIFSKIFERSMVNRLTKFCDKHSILFKNQFGFQSNRSTFDALKEFTEKLYSGLDLKHETLAILVDLKKAFDCVDHSILLNKIEYYGIRGISAAWFRDYLSNRKQHVRINSCVSTSLPVAAGVPQGSILGPILFLLYINDIPNSTKMSSYLFADDTNFVESGINGDGLAAEVNVELSNVGRWCSSNKLVVNSKKTEVLRISNLPESNLQMPIVMQGENVNFSNHCTFLGIVIDKKLNFSRHIDKVSKKISKNCGILYKIRDNLTLKARINYYYAFIYPLLSYNVAIWGGTGSTHLSILIRAQKRIIRTIAGLDRYAHTNPIFADLKILKFNDIYKLSVAVFMYKTQTSPDFAVRHDHNTRNRNCLNPIFHRLSRTQQALSYVGPTIWNELPENIRHLDTLNKFKINVKEYFLSLYTSSVV